MCFRNDQKHTNSREESHLLEIILFDGKNQVMFSDQNAGLHQFA